MASTCKTRKKQKRWLRIKGIQDLEFKMQNFGFDSWIRKSRKLNKNSPSKIEGVPVGGGSVFVREYAHTNLQTPPSLKRHLL